jgi:hypothetical protein
MNLQYVPALALLIVVAYGLAGLALQHAAYILQYGSIFDPLRRWLERTACAPGSPRIARWACAHARELVGCQLCSITQLSIWFCAVPATTLAARWGGLRPLGLAPALAVGAYALLGAGIAFSTAAVGLLCWDLARFVGRGTDALVLFLRAKKEAAEAEALRPRPTVLLGPGQGAVPRREPRILRTAGSRERRA